MPRPVTPPLQERSAKTLEKIVEAAESLLKEKPFEQVTIRDIVSRAGCPISSFYARFKSKDDLLPHLYQRYDTRVGPNMSEMMSKLDPAKLTLEKAVELGIDLMLETYSRDRWLMREIALYARRHPEAIGDDIRRERTGMHAGAAKIFASFGKEIQHKDPVRAGEVGIFVVASTAREAILFEGAPHASATGLSREALRQTLIHTLLSFLTTPCKPPHLCCLPSRSSRSPTSRKKKH